MRVPNDSPESLKFGLGFAGCWGAWDVLSSLRTFYHTGVFLGHVFLTGIAIIAIVWFAWNWVYYEQDQP